MAEYQYDIVAINAFNKDIRKWGQWLRNSIATGAKNASQGRTKKRKFAPTSTQVSYKVRLYYGIADRIALKLPPKGIFMEYGVGRAYARSAVKSGQATFKGYGVEKRKERPYIRPILSANIDDIAETVAKHYAIFTEKAIVSTIENRNGTSKR